MHASKTSGKSVTLSWKPPEDDGGCKIGNYIIEYNRVKITRNDFAFGRLVGLTQLPFRFAGRLGHVAKSDDQ